LTNDVYFNTIYIINISSIQLKEKNIFMFKVGDVIIGIEGADEYVYTCRNSICVVTNISQSCNPYSIARICVKIIETPAGKLFKGQEYWIEESRFRKYGDIDIM